MPATDFDKRLGRWLRYQMTRSGLTTTDAVERLGLPMHTIRRQLRGEVRLTAAQLAAWSDFLGADLVIRVTDDAPAPGLEPGTYRFTARVHEGVAA